MGTRGWLNKLLNNEILPAIAQLENSQEGRAEIEKAIQLVELYSLSSAR